MSRTSLLASIALGLITAFLSFSTWADRDDLSNRALKRLRSQGATVIVGVKRAQLYSSPKNAGIVSSATWMEELLVDNSRLSSAPIGWLPVSKTEGEGHVSPGPNVWVHRNDVVIGDNFKKVIGCWPIQSMTHEIGDVGSVFDFKMDGSGVVRDSSYERYVKTPHQGRIQIYMDGSIVKFVNLTKGIEKHAFAGYDSHQRRGQVLH